MLFLAAWLGQPAAVHADDGGGAGETEFALQLSGQVSLGVIAFSDGATRRVSAPVDNDVESSRLRLELSAEPGHFAATLRVEGEFWPRSAADASDPDGDAGGYGRDNLRLLELGIESERYGRLWLGQGAMASDDVAEELGGVAATFVVAEPAVEEIASQARLRARMGERTERRIGEALDTYSGLGRALRLRYDTPEWEGLRLSLSYGQDRLVGRERADLIDAALSLGRAAGPLDLQGVAAIGWRGGRRGLGASSSALHRPSGISLALAAGEEAAGFGFVKLGWQRDLLPHGRTYLAVDRWWGSGHAAEGGRSRSHGATLVQAMDDLDAELWLTARRFEYRGPGIAYRPVDVVFAGVRVQF